MNKWQEKGVDCYYVTARPNNRIEADSTRKWLVDTFGLSEEELDQYVSLMGDLSCSQPPYPDTTRIAYKDVVRRAYSDRDGAYWIMSMGDQLVDVFGTHSGVKVLLPNLFFDKAIVRKYYEGPGDTRTQMITPSRECYNELKDSALEVTNINYSVE